MIKTVSVGIPVVLLVAWFALFFSNRGVLIGWTSPEGGVGMLECRYFTGTNLIERKHLFKTPLGLGRDTCPRIVVATE